METIHLEAAWTAHIWEAKKVTATKFGSIIDADSTHLADYSYLGMATFVQVDYTEPDVKFTLIDLSLNNDPDTGDIYSGGEKGDSHQIWVVWIKWEN